MQTDIGSYKQQIKDDSLHLETFQLLPSNSVNNSWANSTRKSVKSAKFSHGSCMKIFSQESSLNYSRRFRHSFPVDSVHNTHANYSNIIKKSEVACKHILKSDYEKLIEQYSLKKVKYTDNEFPPVQKSIGHNLPIYQWRRLSQIIQSPQFMSQIIQPSDVLQGEIGDCYFLSAVAAMAEKDYRIKNIFPSLEIQSKGIYMARILHEGILREVVVDDFIPVKQNGEPVFAKPAGGKEIWVIILEKCWAKLYGSYQKIIGGLPHEVLHAFSGAPTYYHAIPENNLKKIQDELFNKIFTSYQNGDILCCGTRPLQSIEQKGLVRGHAYTILMKIRNPWGKKQWNGRASEKDKQFWSMLSESFKESIGYKDRAQDWSQDNRQMDSTRSADGIFFMLWEDFSQMFEMVDVCQIRDNASYFCSATQLTHKNGKLFEFKLSEPNQITIAISQKSLRGDSYSEKMAGYSKSTLILAKCIKVHNNYEYKFIKSSQNQAFPDHYLDAHVLTEGHYVFFAKIDWLDKAYNHNPHQTVISLYTQAKVLLKQASKTQHPQYLFKVFMNHARRNIQRRQIISQSPLQWICSDFLANHGSYGYSAYHIDPMSEHRFCIQFDQSQFEQQNLILKKPYKRNGKIKTTLKPGQQLIILFRLKAYHFTQALTIPTPKVYKLSLGSSKKKVATTSTIE